VITRERSLERRGVLKAAARSMAADGRHEGVRMYKHVFEQGDGSRPEHGVATIRNEVVERGVVGSRVEAGEVGTGVGFHAHVIPVTRRGETKRCAANSGLFVSGTVCILSQDWEKQGCVLGAGRGGVILSAPVSQWGRRFVESGKEFESVDGVGCFEYVEKRIWNLNPLFRMSVVYLAHLFDRGEKNGIHASLGRGYVGESVADVDAARPLR
jgi:hypothetical protein